MKALKSIRYVVGVLALLYFNNAMAKPTLLQRAACRHGDKIIFSWLLYNNQEVWISNSENPDFNNPQQFTLSKETSTIQSNKLVYIRFKENLMGLDLKNYKGSGSYEGSKFWALDMENKDKRNDASQEWRINLASDSPNFIPDPKYKRISMTCEVEDMDLVLKPVFMSIKCPVEGTGGITPANIPIVTYNINAGSGYNDFKNSVETFFGTAENATYAIVNNQKVPLIINGKNKGGDWQIVVDPSAKPYRLMIDGNFPGNDGKFKTISVSSECNPTPAKDSYHTNFAKLIQIGRCQHSKSSGKIGFFSWNLYDNGQATWSNSPIPHKSEFIIIDSKGILPIPRSTLNSLTEMIFSTSAAGERSTKSWKMSISDEDKGLITRDGYERLPNLTQRWRLQESLYPETSEDLVCNVSYGGTQFEEAKGLFGKLDFDAINNPEEGNITIAPTNGGIQ